MHCSGLATANGATHEEVEGDEAGGTGHHHHVEKEQQRLLRIGVQTALSLCIHKLPEGALIFVSSKASQGLGTAIFISLSVHNVAEGFSMGFPLYVALNSRFKAILFTSIVSLLQPLGALIAYLVMGGHHNNTGENPGVVYGAIFAVTAGTMTAIAVQLFETRLGKTTETHASGSSLSVQS